MMISEEDKLAKYSPDHRQVRIITPDDDGKFYSVLPWRIPGDLLAHREVISSLMRREFDGRFRGSLLGALWIFLNPLAQLAIYFFIFSVVFNMRWGETSGVDGTIDFIVNLFAGLVLFSIFSEALTRGPSLLISQQSFVKKVLFPIETYPLAVSFAGMLFGVANLVILLLLVVFTGYGFSWTWLVLPLPLVGLAMLTVGICWFGALCGVVVRDTSQIMILFSQILFYGTPIIYPLSMVPEPYRIYLRINPLTNLVEAVRSCLLKHSWPDWGPLGYSMIVSFLIAWGGYVAFMKAKRTFADVL